MALSNWDTCAFDANGKPSGGVITVKRSNDQTAQVEIYKNWLYVRATDMWTKGYSYVEPTIAEIQYGDVQIAGFRIYATRGPQNSVLTFVEAGWKHLAKSGEGHYDCMCGIGCYAFKGDECVGVQQDTFDKLGAFLIKLKTESIVDDDYIQKILAVSPMRFNQGDGFFAEKLGEGIPGTKIGEANDPLLFHLIKET